MTEKEWLTSNNPQAMLQYLGQTLITDRKLRLFACGCCRQVWHRLTDKRSRNAVGVAEWYADGGSGDSGKCPWFPDAVMTDWGYMQIAHREAHKAWQDAPSLPALLASYCCFKDTLHAASSILHRSLRVSSQSSLAAMFRSLIGNPFRPVTLLQKKVCDRCGYTLGKTPNQKYCNRKAGGDPDGKNPHKWVSVVDCSWRTPTVLALAEAAYQEPPAQKCTECRGVGWVRDHVPYADLEKCITCCGTGQVALGHLDPIRLSILADALEEAGCDNEDIVQHLRGKESCWSCRDEGAQWQTCDVCNKDRLSWDNWSPWVGLRGKHVRGDWAVDCILGKE